VTSFSQLPGEPSDAFEQLLLHRDFGPSRQFSQTADVVGCSESTLRRRAEQWNWAERLAFYDSGMLHKLSEARTEEEFDRHKRLDSSETSINLYVKNKKKNKGNPGDQTILH